MPARALRRDTTLQSLHDEIRQKKMNARKGIKTSVTSFLFVHRRLSQKKMNARKGIKTMMQRG